MACSTSCSLCKNLIISQSVTIVTVNGIDTLVIDLPAGTYNNCSKYCIVIAQSIPTTATIAMPVAFSIGGVTTTVYPFTRCNCVQVTACAIRTRRRYSTRLFTNAAGGATFRALADYFCCAPNNAPLSIPVATATAPTTPASAPVEASITPTDLADLGGSKAITKSVTTKTTLKAD